jgi:hypothetical protein
MRNLTCKVLDLTTSESQPSIHKREILRVLLPDPLHLLKTFKLGVLGPLPGPLHLLKDFKLGVLGIQVPPHSTMALSCRTLIPQNSPIPSPYPTRK